MCWILLILMIILTLFLSCYFNKKRLNLETLSDTLCPNGKCITSAGDNPQGCCCEPPLVFSPGGGSGMPYCLDKNAPGCVKICQDESCGCDGFETCDQPCANNCIVLCDVNYN